jgi:hypothetical protein
MKRLLPDEPSFSLQDIQKQARIVNEWKEKVEETETLLAVYNSRAAKEGGLLFSLLFFSMLGFVLAQMMCSNAELADGAKPCKPSQKKPSPSTTSGDARPEASKRAKKSEVEAESLSVALSQSTANNTNNNSTPSPVTMRIVGVLPSQKQVTPDAVPDPPVTTQARNFLSQQSVPKSIKPTAKRQAKEQAKEQAGEAQQKGSVKLCSFLVPIVDRLSFVLFIVSLGFVFFIALCLDLFMPRPPIPIR